MRPNRIGPLLAALGCLLVPSPGRGDEPAPPPGSTPIPAPEGTATPPTEAAAVETNPEVAPVAADTSPPTDAAAARVQVAERIKAIAGADDKGESPGSKAIREALDERIKWLDEWDRIEKARIEAERTDKSPEREDAEQKAELERVRATLDQAAKDPESLLPGSFRVGPEGFNTAVQAEMKEAIDATQADLKKSTQAATELEESSRKTGVQLAGLRAERDKLHQRCITQAARRADREKPLNDPAASPQARELAAERLLSFDWEARVECESLRLKELQIELETRRAAVHETRATLLDAHRELARRSLEAMQTRYRGLVQRQQSGLRANVAHEEGRAAVENDPVKRYQARRNAERLALEAKLLGDEQALSAGQGFSVEDQTALADQAASDFENLKRLVETGRSRALIALRLKNDYRRLPRERDALVRGDLAAAHAEMAESEQELTDVELELIGDGRDERFVLEALIEAVPPDRRREVRELADGFEARRRALLLQRRAVRQKLADRADGVHQQVLRRLEVLDDRYAFVRTHIFWVRDAEPIGQVALSGVPREFRAVGRSVLRLAGSAADGSNWGPPSTPFSLTLAGIVGLPLPLYRIRRRLRDRISPGRGTIG